MSYSLLFLELLKSRGTTDKVRVRVCVCQTQIRLCAGVAASDSLPYGSWCHMATCQQAGGGNTILRRKLAVISWCTLSWESSRLSTTGSTALDRPADARSTSLTSLVSLSLFSPSVCFCPVLWPAPSLSSQRSSELHYNVCGSFSAVSTQRYGFFLYFFTPGCFSIEFVVLFHSFFCGLVLTLVSGTVVCQVKSNET